MRLKTIRIAFCLFAFLPFCLNASGQSADSVVNKLTCYAQTVYDFSKYIPREKVCLHFDNTGYYQGDNIWFKCYVVTSDLHLAAQLSKTLYVELLNPGGDVIDKRILKIEKGQCHGEFKLDRIPFYSGFYEVRAYTKYMMNFGEDVIFSRLLPVFNKPKEEGNFEEKDMLKYGYGNFPTQREKPYKGKKVNLKLFPEGGSLIQGIESQVAFEATDAFGSPLEVTGTVINEAKEEISKFNTTHNGRGVFSYTPVGIKQKAIISYEGKNYQFDMPAALSRGYVLTVDNLSQADSIGISVQKNSDTPAQMLGMMVVSQGKYSNYCLIDIADAGSVSYNIDKTSLPSGVSWIVLFDASGKIVCDRMVFTNKAELLSIKSKTDKESYNPYELVDMEFAVTDKDAKPVKTTFSLSVTDGMNEVESTRNILTDLLLMSEIKGYVHNPYYYFEADDLSHRAALDQLLMVQGWRRYSWNQMAGIEPFDLKYRPEQGIETHGKVVSFVRGVPKPNIEVSAFLLKRGENEEAATFADLFVTDSLGRFSFRTDEYGKMDMIFSVTEKGKKKDHRIILDRLFNPTPKRYEYVEMQINLTDAQGYDKEMPDAIEEDIESFLAAIEDSLAKSGFKEKTHSLKEVKVVAKKRSRERDIFENRSKSIAYYDVHSEMDNIKDSGKFIGNDINQLMLSINKNFTPIAHIDFLRYKNKMPLFVVDYQRTNHNELDLMKYKLINLDAIKSIYINEDLSIIHKYADMRLSRMEVSDTYGCAVFIETYPEGKIPTQAGKGVRKTWLEGYSQVKEFYSPDYTLLQPEPDYRRTLYWNPEVSTDNEGKAKIRFYNNSRCRKFRISAETVTSQGVIGVFEE